MEEGSMIEYIEEQLDEARRYIAIARRCHKDLPHAKKAALSIAWEEM